MKTLGADVLLAILMMLSISAAAQRVVEYDQPASTIDPSAEPTMMRIVPYRDETYPAPDLAPAVPSCYRVGRCSAYDIYRFRDRPNRLTRLAPEAPPESAVRPASNAYLWMFVPVTPEENILPKYRNASQVREEYRAVGRLIGDPN